MHNDRRKIKRILGIFFRDANIENRITIINNTNVNLYYYIIFMYINRYYYYILLNNFHGITSHNNTNWNRLETIANETLC